MEQLFLELVEKWPWVMIVLTVIGVIRLIVKPAMSIFRSVAEMTETDADNKVADSIESSAFWKGFIYVLDWFSSIKLKK